MSDHVFDKKAWSEKSIFWQMGNIGSEVGRALAAKRQGKEERKISAFYRGMDLFNATIESRLGNNESIGEILIAREQFAKSILTDEEDSTLEKYFMEFAMAERLNK